MRFMTPPDGCSEAEWILETIIDDFARSLDVPDRARFYAFLVDLLIERRDRLQRASSGGDPNPEPFERVH